MNGGSTYQMADFDPRICEQFQELKKLIEQAFSRGTEVWRMTWLTSTGTLKRLWNTVYGDTQFAYDDWKHVLKDVVCSFSEYYLLQ